MIIIAISQMLVRKQHEETKNVKMPTIIDAFKTPRLRRNMSLVMVAWTLTYMIFDGHVRNIVNLNYDIYTTFTLSSALEFPADVVTIYSIDYLGRRWTTFSSFFMASSCMMMASFVLGVENNTLIYW
jgi:hypothetical protein